MEDPTWKTGIIGFGVSLLFCSSVEDRNFALFNFVNEQTNEAEALKEQISKVSVFFPL